MSKARSIKGTAARQLPLGMTELNPARELGESFKRCTLQLAHTNCEGAGVHIHPILKSFLQGCPRWFNFWPLSGGVKVSSRSQRKPLARNRKSWGVRVHGHRYLSGARQLALLFQAPSKGTSLGFSISFIPDRQGPCQLSVSPVPC